MKSHKFGWTVGASVFLSGVLALGDVLPAAAEAAGFGQYLSGSEAAERKGTEDEYTVITISTEEELAGLARSCRLDAWSRDKYVKLDGDIAISGDQEIMIPVFGGIFDGCGHSISGLDIGSAGSSMGLFRYIQAGGVVRNLAVSGRVSPEGSGSRTGLLAGVNYGRIINCKVSGTVEGAEMSGGLVGVNEAGGEIRSCQSAAVVTGNHYTGGICGINRGILNGCSNSGSINTYSVDVSFGIEDITMENLEDINSTENVAAHTDTGGIAGYSQGKIFYCSNSGTVGYRHVGYNTGGIVGRLHQGYLQNCTNTGHILGRKDVGGIAGQMEPFLQIQYLNDKLSEIDREADVFFDLLDETLDELDQYGGQTADLSRDISSHLRIASTAAGNLMETGNDLWYIYNQELTGINDDLKRLNQEWSDQAERDKENKAPARPGFTVSGGDAAFPDGWDSDIGIDIQADLESYLAALRRFGEGTSAHLNNITAATEDRSGGINGNLEILNQEMEAAGNGLEKLTDVLDRGQSRISSKADALAEQARVLRRSICELRDDLFRYEGISVEDGSDEAAGGSLDNLGAEAAPGPEGSQDAYYDTSSFQQGKITLCVNKGTVEADTNVGGIAGQVAIEYDFDPEDDIAISGTESFNLEQTIKAVVRESRNLGDVTGKKNYVGGIVGKADYGAVISCESYGRVESTGGSYVGGIAGSSGYCIRSCYYMGVLAGKDYVGGIVGRGCDVFYSCAYPELAYSGECAGSIAGSLQEEGVICGNYYVEPSDKSGKGFSEDLCVPGVDSVGYAGGAAPLDYESFCAIEGLPEAFSRFTVSFQAEGRELASIVCGYGQEIDGSLVPQVPEKEGYYGRWPEFDYNNVIGNRVLEAEYEKWVTSLAGSERDEKGRALVLVQGQFLPEDRLRIEQAEHGTVIYIVQEAQQGVELKDGRKREVTVRVLCADHEDVAVEVQEGSTMKRVPAEKIGSYLEFSMELPGVYQIVCPEEDSTAWIYAGWAGAAAAAVLMIRQLGKYAKRKKPVGR